MESAKIAEVVPEDNILELEDQFSTAGLLKKWNLNYRVEGNYFHIGELTQTQGWIFDISLIPSDFISFGPEIIEFLSVNVLPFKIISSLDLLIQSVSGALGYHHVGRIIIIYPSSGVDLEALAFRLINLTKKFRGPEVPTDKYLGGTVYTRYGAHESIKVVGLNGKAVELIYNSAGQLMETYEPIPFQLPKDIYWPFARITSPKVEKPSSILNGAYIPYKAIKTDVKGIVVKGINVRKILDISWCLIKQGRKWAFVDEYDRDVRVRIDWQFQLHKILDGKINIPSPIDLFYKNEDVYFVTDFIEGISFNDYIGKKYKVDNWGTFGEKEKLEVLDLLLQILHTIKSMHSLNIVHRDITPANFLIDNKGVVFVIDLELAYDLAHNYPAPPFRLGTYGYMSPEQENEYPPCLADDYYGAGALMYMIFTGLHPFKAKNPNRTEFINQVNQFIEDESIAITVGRCLTEDPEDRPTIDDMIADVLNYINRIRNNKKGSVNVKDPSISPGIDLDERFINDALRGLVRPSLLSPEGVWLTNTTEKLSYVQNENLSKSVYPGLMNGVCGPMYVYSVVRKSYLIPELEEVYQLNWEYIKSTVFGEGCMQLPAGLYAGKAGIGMAIASGIRHGLIPDNEYSRSMLNKCIDKDNGGISLARGLSGVGFALLRVGDLLPKDFVKEQLDAIVEQLRSSSIGERYLKRYTKLKLIELSLSSGISGLLLFLLTYYETYRDNKEVMDLIDRYLVKLHRNCPDLIKKLNQKSTHKVDMCSLGNGVLGIASIFIKAFGLFGENKYRVAAIDILDNVPVRRSDYLYGIEEGIAGKGEIYLDAYEAFGNVEYLNKATYYASVLLHSCYRFEGQAVWLSGHLQYPIATLGSGNSGILHFLMRYKNRGLNNLLLFKD